MKKGSYWLIPIVVTFIVGYFGRQVGAAQITSTTDYDVFFRLLSILLALLVGAGALIYLVIRRVVTEKVQDQIKNEFSRIEGRLLIHEGVMYYYHGLYEKAITLTKNTLPFEKVHKEPDIIFAKNNLAYYYAARHKQEEHWEDKKQALKLAKFAYDKYDPLRNGCNEPEWVDTYAFVKAVFAKTPEEKREVRKLVGTLLSRRDLQPIREKLRKNLDYL